MMVQAFGPPNQVPPHHRPGQPLGVERPGPPAVERPGPPQVQVPPPEGPAAPGVPRPGGVQANNGTDTLQVTQQAVRAFNAGTLEARATPVPLNPTTEQAAVAAGVPPEPPPLAPEEPREEEANVRAQEEPPPPPEPPPAPIPEVLREFAPGQARGQNMDIIG